MEERIRSPFDENGEGILRREYRVIYYRGKRVEYEHLFYVCSETNVGFTTTEVDTINLNRIIEGYQME